MTTKSVVIKFFAPVIEVTINALMNAIDQKMKQGGEQISSFSFLHQVARFFTA